ncbi:ribosomal protein S18-alanine N-acetyltransferase [Solimicrobium silvestre]|uniref:[Ribosomal protein bS18]-alanine N-acetyltransferase n=1 Tax=Solimicrobium silvestre TaxID=2099400 RepID=A0A2S9GUY2_9BURK|nr:ribosomal protein S18-alanine N-acetyltransferase [Solimicrobium silvestre]PRC91508.1 rimI: ribosomal-protein-alanine acetyltransferase [Solimicrobium silvestre]
MTIDWSTLKLEPMQLLDLDEVMAIEQAVYSHPWSIGNFVDSLDLAYDAWVVRSVEGELLGYFVQMPVVDEMHLLTIAVQGLMQGQGLGYFLLKHMAERAKLMQMDAVLLEVRVSNLRALAVYEVFGFLSVGRRKDYYQTEHNQREDALILRYTIQR